MFGLDEAAEAIRGLVWTIQTIIYNSSADIDLIRANILRVSTVAADAVEGANRKLIDQNIYLVQQTLLELIAAAQLVSSQAPVYLDIARVYAFNVYSLIFWAVLILAVLFIGGTALVAWYFFGCSQRRQSGNATRLCEQDMLHVHLNYGAGPAEVAETCIAIIKHKKAWAVEAEIAPTDAQVVMVPVGLGAGISARIWRAIARLQRDGELEAMLLPGTHVAFETLTRAFEAAGKYSQSSSQPRKPWFLFLLFSFQDPKAHGPRLHEPVHVPAGVSACGFTIVSAELACVHSLPYDSTITINGKSEPLYTNMRLLEDSGISWHGQLNILTEMSNKIFEKKDI